MYTVFLTGSTGTLGPYLIAELLQRGIAVAALIHAPEKDRKKDWLMAFLRTRGLGGNMHRIRWMAGDVRLPDAGLSPGDAGWVKAHVTHMLHAAATTSFMLRLPEARRINTNGTRQMLRLAGECRHLLALGHISTVYVCGRRGGVIRETELVANDGFVNTYEQSKFEAEQLLRAGGSRLPWAVYRLSAIIGDSQTGQVSTFQAVHRAFGLCHKGLAPMVPGIPTQPADLISVNYTADAIIRLFTDNFHPGTTYHLVSGPQYSYTLESLLTTTIDCFARFDPGWENKRIEQPPIVSEETFRLLEESARQADDGVLLSILRLMGSFMPHLSILRSFDTANVKRDLSGISCEHIDTYYDKIIRYCLASQWGRRAYDPTTV